MTRRDIIQKVIDKIGAQTYLEIGVEFGTVFLRIMAKRKIAVDPAINIPWYKKLYFCRSSARSKYFELPSDEFFEKHPDLFTGKKIDVVFVDGLHTNQQSLRDVLNCLKYLNKNGVIIMHDCDPESSSEAAPSIEEAKKIKGWNGSWCGDVWKTIVYLRSARRDLRVFVLDCDHGVGIITAGEPENALDYSDEEIKRMTYDDLMADRKRLLNLKNPEYLNEFLNNLS